MLVYLLIRFKFCKKLVLPILDLDHRAVACYSTCIMSSAKPWTRRVAPAWLPNTADAASNDTAQQEPITTSKAFQENSGSSDDDELNRLTRLYEAEAATSRSSAQQEQANKQPQRSMAELRKDGLSTPLSAHNKGYQLLAKMGYQAGQGLGSSAPGTSVPIDVVLKTTKAGLGVDEGKNRKRREAEIARSASELKRAKTQEQSQVSFRARTVDQFSAAASQRHLSAARKSIQTLDEVAGVGRHKLWTPVDPFEDVETMAVAEVSLTAPTESEIDTWELLPASQRLAEAVEYLRSEYCYCMFCGCKFDDCRDMDENCPGADESEH